MSFKFYDEQKDSGDYSFGDMIDMESYSSYLSCHPVVSYKYIRIDGKYGFGQDVLDNKDAVAYFDSMNVLASITINEFRDLEKEWHFHPEDVRRGGILYEELRLCFGEDMLKRPETLPAFYHFALYEDKKVRGDRTHGTKAPRIHLFIGDGGVLFPMFYDPYHEMNPTDY